MTLQQLKPGQIWLMASNREHPSRCCIGRHVRDQIWCSYTYTGPSGYPDPAYVNIERTFVPQPDGTYKVMSGGLEEGFIITPLWEPT